MGKPTHFEHDDAGALARVTLSDDTVIEGDALPRLDFKATLELVDPWLQRDRRALARKVLEVFRTEKILQRKLTIEDVAVLIGRVTETENINGMQAALFALVGMRVFHQHNSGKGGAARESAAARRVDELLRTTKLSDTAIARESQKEADGGMTRQAVGKRRRKLSA